MNIKELKEKIEEATLDVDRKKIEHSIAEAKLTALKGEMDLIFSSISIKTLQEEIARRKNGD
jgi:hypothetical protein